MRYVWYTIVEETCADLGELADGVKYGAGPFSIGDRMNYECLKGFRLVGSPTLTCGRGGLWDSPKPTCRLACEYQGSYISIESYTANGMLNI